MEPPAAPASSSRSSSAGSSSITHTSDHTRNQSETTLFSIYSMYGNAPPVPPAKEHIPTVSVTLPVVNGRSSIAYYDDTDDLPPKSPPTRTIDLTRPGVLLNGVPPRTSSFRPLSSHYTGPMLEERRASTYSPTPSSSRPVSSRPDSLLVLPPLPPSRNPSPTPPPTPPLTAPLSPAPLSPSMPLKHPVSAPGSKTSLVPSEGEDLDGFYVRNTYAQLDMTGVKGDGFEDGVERTRARIGPSRASQLYAANAVGDGTEKSQELDPREIQTLHTVDRYGFFSTPSHDRLILLPASSFDKRLSVVRGGPSSARPSAQSLNLVPKATPPVKENLRIEKWTKMMQAESRDQGANVQSWRVKQSKQGKLRLRTYKGVPDRWRPAAWEMFMTNLSRATFGDTARLASDYRDALDKPSTYDIQIDLDVPRTISGHIFYRTRYGAGQRSLFHVLHCFSLRCSECGYVQGMGPIAATLLCYLDPEKTYASLVRLHDAYSMHSIFSPGFPGLLEAIYVQERITEQMMPDVYKAFQKHTISTTSYATKWYITLFSNSVPFQTQLRLWDAFLLEGPDVFVAVAVAIVWVYRDHITAASANFETILSLLSSFFVPEAEDAMLLWIERALADRKLRASMTQWRVEWKALVAAGKESTVLL
ncbi:Rab-GAP TBC domain-containing protein [Mycena indigotica]|uniref:Rab-GAP TBC domain-containing protein n=1 Tax=Mycena indigotica TaxID=2126181 RepID=A0A8H6W724_9AGAR|nr:Rab-GAP TBC domain-containing protein [Mycena indigotica]KAF7307247.1 Rab-GAP TBC domain-containing protein [Mycena indigotica]